MMSLVSQMPAPARGGARSLLAAARPIAADMGGTLAFYLIYLVTGSPRVGAAIGLALGLAQLASLKARGRKAPPLLVMGVTLTAVLGGVTFFSQDPRFLLLKPSIIYVCVGLTMTSKGWLGPYLPHAAREALPATTIDRAGWVWAGLMFATALLNLALVAALPPRSAAGVLTIWTSGSKLALFLVQYASLKRSVRRASAQAA